MVAFTASAAAQLTRFCGRCTRIVCCTASVETTCTCILLVSQRSCAGLGAHVACCLRWTCAHSCTPQTSLLPSASDAGPQLQHMHIVTTSTAKACLCIILVKHLLLRQQRHVADACVGRAHVAAQREHLLGQQRLVQGHKGGCRALGACLVWVGQCTRPELVVILELSQRLGPQILQPCTAAQTQNARAGPEPISSELRP